MFLSYLIISCLSFNPICNAKFGWDLWGSVSDLYCDGDALLTIDSQVITRDKWTNIGSWNNHVKGTLKIQGNGKVIVEGGFRINGWTQDSQNPHILKTKVDKTIHGMGDAEDFVSTWKFESLWVNDKEAIRARVPSSWTLPTIKSVSTSGSGEFISYTVGVPSSTMRFLRDLSQDELHQVNIVIFHYWATTRARISSINTYANTITFTAHSTNYGNNKGIEAGTSYFYLDNLKTALTKPGEWYLSDDGDLYYYPREGETASNIEVYASHNHRLMYIETNNLILENIEFRHCGGNIPETGATREDLIPTKTMKCIDVYRSSNVQFINCRFRHVFCRALSIYDCSNCVIEGCLVEDFGADGIAVGASSNTRIYNNILRHGGRVIHHENAIYDNYDPGAVISHNEISDNFWDGINCYLEDKPCDMKIEKNHVHHIGFGLLDDIGCIYVTNAKKGVVLQNNYVHNADCHTYGAWGLYVDLDCHEVLVQNNLAHDFFDGCIHFHYGYNNVVTNNILGFNKKGLLSKGQNNQGTMVDVYKNIFITNEGNFYCDLWDGNSFNSYSNLYWDFGQNIQWFRDNDGRDNTGSLADPKFKDPLNRDFTFTDDSVAKGVGFVPFDYSDCGVVGEEWRKEADDYQLPDVPQKSTDDEALLNNEKMYPNDDGESTSSSSNSSSGSGDDDTSNATMGKKEKKALKYVIIAVACVAVVAVIVGVVICVRNRKNQYVDSTMLNSTEKADAIQMALIP